ncbi:Probable hybrid two-component system sensor histidine kinase and response regulator receiver [Flavobacterium indicum GPTSA100-9 = DSM 17447]|uniref:histidine kinase n=1 Tax=Flavobacterium indicum (strain DSM 17447 / CIP 109464 / GPTSA100-9) TaxID=1094466 RepID=H8XU62_FLAIG|nr:ATP-binding protein [Flavobacterium indicum]CCG52845.1 Probable hybrid two-component system sensor histidine kinase and response regulator receiver [Flavobacterium indicum GPTSA100-9 = DSM 17447]
MKKSKLIVFLLFVLQIVFSQGISDKDKLARTLYTKALKNLNDFKCSESLYYSQKLLDYSLQKNRPALAAVAYNIIGLNFEEFGDLKKSAQYYNSGLKYANIAKNDTLRNYIYNNMGNLYYFKFKDAIKGLYFYKKCYEISKRVDTPIDVAFSEINLADVYLELKQYQEAFNFLTLVQQKIQPTDYEIGMSFYSLMGNYYEMNHDFKKAEYYYLKCINDFKYLNLAIHKAHQSDIYLLVSKFYEKKNDAVKSLNYLKKHDSLQDILFNQERKFEFRKAGGDLEALENKLKVQQIETDKKIQEQKISEARRFTTIVLIFLAILIVFLIFIFKGYVNYKELNSKLFENNEQLKLAQEKTEEATKLKSQFLSNVSHELRTPLYGVIGMAQILESEHKEIKDSPYFNALKFSSNYLLTLINDVLNVYKIEDNDIEFNYELIDIRKEINHINDSMNVIAKSNCNELIVSISEDFPKYIKTDLTRFSQILINLVSNALKFTHHGKVEIKLDLIEKNTNQCIQLQVIDNGIGIPKEFLDKIFEKFVQVDVHLQEQYKGTGLGLSIVKRLVDLFKGSISLTSEINKGSNFTILLPYLNIDSNLELHQLSNYHLDHLKPLKILVAEDNKINQMVTKKLLEKNHHYCKIVENGIEAVNCATNEKFDLILMDINMPELNGIDATTKLRALGITIPIIALTASDKENILKDIKDNSNGLTDVLVKPFEYHDLQLIISKYIN